MTDYKVFERNEDGTLAVATHATLEAAFAHTDQAGHAGFVLAMDAERATFAGYFGDFRPTPEEAAMLTMILDVAEAPAPEKAVFAAA